MTFKFFTQNRIEMRHHERYILLSMIVIFCIFSGCKKFLDAKPDKKLAVISSLEELQSLLDYYWYMNVRDVGAGEVSADDYYISDADYTGWYSETEKRRYTWEKDFLFDPAANDWYNIYRCVYRANTVLDNMETVDKNENPTAWKDIKGQQTKALSISSFTKPSCLIEIVNSSIQYSSPSTDCETKSPNVDVA